MSENPSKITVQVLNQFPEFKTFHSGKAEKSATPVPSEEETSTAADIDAVQTPEEVLENSYLAIQNSLANELLDTVKKMSIIKEDKLGLDNIYIQAKKWADAIVGRSVVQAFAGSLEGHRARKGVMITTSSFSNDAKNYVQKIEKKIVLIDGKRLAHLMIEHNVGVIVRKTYALKKVDQDFFGAE